jgi:NAD(P)-dependent dehydrogenase (short-subunit alcohol dehydrogenase family)
MADPENHAMIESSIERDADLDARCVVVTGASTGIGYAVAQELIAHGYRVIGTVRKEEDADRLRAELGGRMHTVLMDVADDEEVARAAAEITEMVGERGIVGLVNNAGVAIAGPLMHVDLEEFRYQFDVNVVGVVAMTQAMLPLLGGRKRSTRIPGRVINLSSVSDYVTLALYGIKVFVMVLGAVATPIWDKMSAQDLERYAKTDYADGVAQMRATTSDLGKGGMPTKRVAKAVRHALEQPKPSARQVVVNDYWRGWLLPKLIPTRLFDWALTKQFGLTRSG